MKEIHFDYYTSLFDEPCDKNDFLIIKLYHEYSNSIRLNIHIVDPLPTNHNLSHISSDISRQDDPKQLAQIIKNTDYQLSSLAFNAARMQGLKHTFQLLKKLRYLIHFNDSKSSYYEQLIDAASECNLNMTQFRKDLHTDTNLLQQLNINKAPNKYKMVGMPTLMIRIDGEKHLFNFSDHKKQADYDQSFNKIEKLVDVFNHPRTHLVKDIDFYLKYYEDLSTSDLCFLSEQSLEFVRSKTRDKYRRGEIVRVTSNNQIAWSRSLSSFKIKRDGFLINGMSIVGGGVAGTAIAYLLKDADIPFRIYEHKKSNLDSGLGFILMKNGIKTLASMGLKNELFKKANKINKFRAITPLGDTISSVKITDCMGISRKDFLSIFQENINKYNITFGKKCTGIQYKNDQINGLMFENEIDSSFDVLVGCDGINSTLRNHLHSEPTLEYLDEAEIVSMVTLPNLDIPHDEFLKVIDVEHSISLGVVPLKNDQYIWFIQYNRNLFPDIDKSTQSKIDFVDKLTMNYPSFIRKLVDQTDIEKSYMWRAKRMDLLPSFHKDKLILIGDAAHPLLSLTSQGANSALVDAFILVSLLSEQKEDESIDDIFQRFYKTRKKSIQHYINEGDALLHDFLHNTVNLHFKVPLSTL